MAGHIAWEMAVMRAALDHGRGPLELSILRIRLLDEFFFRGPPISDRPDDCYAEDFLLDPERWPSKRGHPSTCHRNKDRVNFHLMHLSWKRTLRNQNQRNEWDIWRREVPKMVDEIENAWGVFLEALEEPDRSYFTDAYERWKPRP